MPGNGEFELQSKEINGGTGGKEGGNDSLIDEKSRDTGAAKPAERPESVESNTPSGQKMVG